MAKRRSRTSLPYKEGTWFAIPLRHGGFAVARVARCSRKGEILAYVFGGKLPYVPDLAEVENLKPDSAIKVWHIGDLGLIEAKWPVIGNSPTWNRDRWPVPCYVRKDDLSRTAWRVTYADDDPSRVISETPTDYNGCDLERDSLLGAGAAEIALSRLLS